MTYKDWLYTLILGGKGSSSSDSGGDSGSNEPLVINMLKVEELPDTWDKTRFGGRQYLLDKTGQEIFSAFLERRKVFCVYNELGYVQYTILTKVSIENDNDNIYYTFQFDSSRFKTILDNQNQYPVLYGSPE